MDLIEIAFDHGGPLFCSVSDRKRISINKRNAGISNMTRTEFFTQLKHFTTQATDVCYIKNMESREPEETRLWEALLLMPLRREHPYYVEQYNLASLDSENRLKVLSNQIVLQNARKNKAHIRERISMSMEKYSFVNRQRRRMQTSTIDEKLENRSPKSFETNMPDDMLIAREVRIAHIQGELLPFEREVLLQRGKARERYEIRIALEEKKHAFEEPPLEISNQMEFVSDQDEENNSSQLMPELCSLMPFEQQGDLSMQTAICMKHRRRLRKHPDILKLLHLFWMKFVVNKGNKMLVKREYVRLHMRISRAVSLTGISFDSARAREFAINEWNRDISQQLSSHRKMSQNTFENALFDIVDVWTITTDTSEYVDFLKVLLHRLENDASLNEPIIGNYEHDDCVASIEKYDNHPESLSCSQSEASDESEDVTACEPAAVASQNNIGGALAAECKLTQKDAFDGAATPFIVVNAFTCQDEKSHNSHRYNAAGTDMLASASAESDFKDGKLIASAHPRASIDPTVRTLLPSVTHDQSHTSLPRNRSKSAQRTQRTLRNDSVPSSSTFDDIKFKPKSFTSAAAVETNALSGQVFSHLAKKIVAAELAAPARDQKLNESSAALTDKQIHARARQSFRMFFELPSMFVSHLDSADDEVQQGHNVIRTFGTGRHRYIFKKDSCDGHVHVRKKDLPVDHTAESEQNIETSSFMSHYSRSRPINRGSLVHVALSARRKFCDAFTFERIMKDRLMIIRNFPALHAFNFSSNTLPIGRSTNSADSQLSIPPLSSSNDLAVSKLCVTSERRRIPNDASTSAHLPQSLEQVYKKPHKPNNRPANHFMHSNFAASQLAVVGRTAFHLTKLAKPLSFNFASDHNIRISRRLNSIDQFSMQNDVENSHECSTQEDSISCNAAQLFNSMCNAKTVVHELTQSDKPYTNMPDELVHRQHNSSSIRHYKSEQQEDIQLSELNSDDGSHSNFVTAMKLIRERQKVVSLCLHEQSIPKDVPNFQPVSHSLFLPKINTLAFKMKQCRMPIASDNKHKAAMLPLDCQTTARTFRSVREWSHSGRLHGRVISSMSH